MENHASLKNAMLRTKNSQVSTVKRESEKTDKNSEKKKNTLKKIS